MRGKTKMKPVPVLLSLRALARSDFTTVKAADLWEARRLAVELLERVEEEFAERAPPCKHRWGYLMPGAEMCTSDCRAIRRTDGAPRKRKAKPASNVVELRPRAA